MSQWIELLVTAIFTGGFFTFLQFLINRKDAKNEALRCLLRGQMSDIYDKYHEDKKIPLSKLEMFNDAFASYEKLKGNGTFKAMHERINKFDIATEVD